MAISKAATLANFSAGGALIVDSTDKRIGVGTTPAVSLDVLGNVEAVGVITASTGFYGELQTAAQPGITSVGTLASLNVTGNATIGGVLTYDDVTNVDSVGVITARNGIHVTSGNVAIGGVSANSRLDVISGDGISITNSTDTFLQNRTTGTTGTNYLEFKDSGGAAGAISYHHNDDSLRVKVSGSERARITGLGSFGVGNDDPTYRVSAKDTKADGTGVQLHLWNNSTNNVAGNVWSGIRFTGSTADYETAEIKGWRVHPGTSLNSLSINTGGGERMVLCSNGVGIGTNNPAAVFHSYHATVNTIAKFESGDAGINIRFKDGDTTNEMGIGALGNDFIVTAASGGERLRVTSAGLVGLSSETPKTDVDLSQKTGAVALPTGTTAQRPSGTSAYIRKNTTNNALEYHNGTNWVEIITDYFPTGSTTLG